MFNHCVEAGDIARVLEIPDMVAIRATLCSIRPELAERPETLRAATLLLAGPSLGFNIDRMTGRSGAPRAFVAACTRRLFDNGVWEHGGAVYTWSTPDDDAFWRDAAVAEGQLCRRRDGLGRIEWAEPGAWKKHYDFSAEAVESLAIRYVSDADKRGVKVDEDKVERMPSRPKSLFQTAQPRPLGRARTIIKSLAPLENQERELVLTTTATEIPRALELFPDANWL